MKTDRTEPLPPERYRSYLRLLASRASQGWACTRFDPSDIVQQTLLDAVGSPTPFKGRSEAEMIGWLRRLLTCNLRDARRAAGRARRDRSREVSIDQGIGGRAGASIALLAAEVSSPSHHLRLQEASLQVRSAIARLPEATRRAVAMRHLDGRSVAEIASELGRSPAAVAGLLKRGLSELRHLITDGGRASQPGPIR